MARKSKMNAHLLVEGPNDLHVISHLCQVHKVPETFDILTPRKGGQIAGGDVQVLRNLRIQLLAKGKRAIGVVLDADEDLMRRWQQLAHIIQEFGYTVSPQPEPMGSIISAPHAYQPTVGIWLMPNNQTVGNLEDFIRYFIPSDDQLRPYADDVLDQIEAAALNKYGHKRSKAFIHTWLAWQKVPGLPMGTSITTKVLPPSAPLALTFVNWLNRLFNP